MYSDGDSPTVIVFRRFKNSELDKKNDKTNNTQLFKTFSKNKSKLELSNIYMAKTIQKIKCPTPAKSQPNLCEYDFNIKIPECFNNEDHRRSFYKKTDFSEFGLCTKEEQIKIKNMYTQVEKMEECPTKNIK
jgi:hypothetical protein